MMIGVSVVLAGASVWLGLLLSYYLGTAGSATIALVAVGIFFVVLHLVWLRRVVRRRVDARADAEAVAA